MSNEDNKKSRGCITGSITGGGGSGGAGHDPRNWGDVVVDGKHYSPEMVKALLTERDALAATVDALRVAWEAGKATDWNKPLEEVFAATPQQHLRDVRAEAGRAGYLIGIQDWRYAELKHQNFNIEKSADNYADSVRAGKK